MCSSAEAKANQKFAPASSDASSEKSSSKGDVKLTILLERKMMKITKREYTIRVQGVGGQVREGRAIDWMGYKSNAVSG